MIKTVIITVTIVSVFYWVVSVVLAQFDEDWSLRWGMGLIYPIAYLLCYPIRMSRKYENGRALYEKAGISKMQYILGRKPDYKSMKFPEDWKF